MRFQFNVKTNDQDYLDYNIFWMLRSPYGKKQIMAFRVAIAIVCAIFVFASLFIGGFTFDSLLSTIPVWIVLLIFEAFLTKFFSWSLKGQIKSLRKSGKMGYSPESFIEFFEEGFSETTPDNKTEYKYTAIERVSLVDNKMIYIHVNNIMAYMLPLSCFETKEQYDEFIEFLESKCTNIDIY